jgi:PTH1 family peptidyl-tRNA hydrolase
MKLVVGLGNPGAQYQLTRHNAGFIVLDAVQKIFEKENLRLKIKFLMPDTFMNSSGRAVAPLIKTKKDLSELIVIYDDIDLPVGKMKISFNRSSGGHNGVESIIKLVKSQEFVRIRIGICPTTPTGKMKKPNREGQVNNFLLAEFKKDELEKIKKLAKPIRETIEIIYTEGLNKAMTLYN